MWKVTAKDRLYIKTLDKRLEPTQSFTIDNPTRSVMNELNRCEDIGLVKLQKLEKIKVMTKDKEKFYCPDCGHVHYVDSNIGKKHLEELVNRNEEIKWRD